MMDILAVPSSGPRSQDRADAGKSPSDKGFAQLLGTLGGKASGPSEPAPRERPDDGREETAAAAEAPAARQPQNDRAKDSAEPAKQGGEQAPADAAENKGQAAGQPANGQPAEDAAENAAENARPGRPAQPSPAGVQGAAAGTVQDAASPAPATAAAQGAAPLQSTAAGLRLPGQNGPISGEVRADAAGQAPRAALSGNTALAASLAASTDAAGQADGGAGQVTQPGGQQAAGRIADGSATKAFAELAAEAAGQTPGQETATGGKSQVLPAPGGGEILLPGGADAARAQTIQPGQPPAAASAAQPQAPASQAPLADQVAVQMHRALSIGKDRLSIQLHPAELGRVDVKLELGQDGPVRAVLQAERKDTLELLQRDARGLERALQNAGLQIDGNSISFDLRGGGQQQRSGQGFASAFAGGEQGPNAGGGESGEAAARPGHTEAHHDGAVNIRV